MTHQIQSIPMNNLQYFINSAPSALHQAKNLNGIQAFTNPTY